MYCDKDSRGCYSIMELDKEQFKTILRALTAYRLRMVVREESGELLEFSETGGEYEIAGAMVRQIEKTL